MCFGSANCWSIDIVIGIDIDIDPIDLKSVFSPFGLILEGRGAMRHRKNR